MVRLAVAKPVRSGMSFSLWEMQINPLVGDDQQSISTTQVVEIGVMKMGKTHPNRLKHAAMAGFLLLDYN
jgi:hypothetical protein